ncbi:MAG: hypothetical protein ACREJD_12990 [Phycisphaerales bacterium]
MSRTLRSPLDRSAPLIFLAIGVAIALGVVVLDHYRDNEVGVWTIVGISALGAFIFWIGNRVSPIANLRVCKVCGVGVSAAQQHCAKCGTEISWRMARILPQVRESPIPCLRLASRSSGGWVPRLPYLMLGLMIILPWLYIAFLLPAVIAIAIPLARSAGGRKVKELIQKLESSGGSLCTVCMYPRHDQGDRCPECGLRETEEEVRAQWERSGLWVRAAHPMNESEIESERELHAAESRG